MSVRNALSIIDGRLDSLFDVLDLEIYNGDLSEKDVLKALNSYRLVGLWEEYEEGYRWDAARRARAERIVSTLRPELQCPSCYMFGDHKMDCSKGGGR